MPWMPSLYIIMIVLTITDVFNSDDEDVINIPPFVADPTSIEPWRPSLTRITILPLANSTTRVRRHMPDNAWRTVKAAADDHGCPVGVRRRRRRTPGDNDDDDGGHVAPKHRHGGNGWLYSSSSILLLDDLRFSIYLIRLVAVTMLVHVYVTTLRPLRQYVSTPLATHSCCIKIYNPSAVLWLWIKSIKLCWLRQTFAIRSVLLVVFRTVEGPAYTNSECIIIYQTCNSRIKLLSTGNNVTQIHARYRHQF